VLLNPLCSRPILRSHFASADRRPKWYRVVAFRLASVDFITLYSVIMLMICEIFHNIV